MSQCVPRWHLGESLRSRSSSTAPADVPIWESGQLAMHGLGLPRVQSTWDKPRAGGTLESIVNQATTDALALGPCFDLERANASAMDALVPCSNRTTHVTDPVPGPRGRCVVDFSTRVGPTKGEDVLNGKSARVARVPVAPEWSSNATFGRDIERVTHDFVGFTSTSTGSQENTSSAKQGTKATATDDHDSFHSASPREVGDEGNKKIGNGKSSISTKRSRAAAIHNQSERKRRDKINQRMKTLQKLVPNSSKTDKASMLDEVIDYLKQLQAQVWMMSRMKMPHMMLPMPMQQQLHMLMMAPMGMGMGMGMGMNSMNRPNITSMPPVVPSPFMSMASWDGSDDHRLQVSPVTDTIATFLACQSQPMTMDAYSRMAAMYQQMQQPPASSSKS